MTTEYIYTTERVRVFYNATRHCYSVKRKVKGKGWRLDHHTTCLTMNQVKFIVNETERQRVIKEGKKYEHAFVEGVITHEKGFYDGKSVYYNPFKTSQFMADCEPITECNEVMMTISQIDRKFSPLIIAK